MSISLSHSRLLAIVLVVVAALSLGLTTPAFAHFAQGSLTGQWLVYGLRTPADVRGTSAEARGAVTFNESGALAAPASLKTLGGDTVGGIDELTTGGLAVSSAGVVQGSLSGMAGVPASTAVTYTINGVMEPGRDVIVGVVTRDLETGASDRIFFVAIRS